MKAIQLKSNGIGRYDNVSPFLVENGALELHIALPQVSGEFFLVAELNGKNLGAVPIALNGNVTVDGLTAGELHAEVKHYLHGELIETYKTEPLVLKSVDKSLSAMPEIAAIMAECDELRKRTNELKEERQHHKEEVERRLSKLVTAFLSFAYAEYQSDVQLNAKGLSAEEFAEALGYREVKIEEDIYEKI